MQTIVQCTLVSTSLVCPLAVVNEFEEVEAEAADEEEVEEAEPEPEPEEAAVFTPPPPPPPLRRVRRLVIARTEDFLGTN